MNTTRLFYGAALLLATVFCFFLQVHAGTAGKLYVVGMGPAGPDLTAPRVLEIVEKADVLLCWLCGGLFALCGALCYGELGARFSKAGGEYVFLRESFGRPMAFLSGWISLVVGFSYHSLSMGSRVQNGLTIFKIGFILVFIAAGLWFGNGSFHHFRGNLPDTAFSAERFAVALIFVSFAYSGWNAAAYLGGEIKNPGKNIPLALLTGTCIVTCLYLLLNVVYVYALLIYIGFTLSLFAMMTVAGLIRVRAARPPEAGDYTTPGYPVTPLLFIAGNAWILFFSIKSRPAASLFGLATIGLGLLAYRYFAGRTQQKPSVPGIPATGMHSTEP